MALPVTTPTLGTFAMIATIRRYWIALLVLVLVGLHASIIGVIRMQALSVKTNLSCEVDLGAYQVVQSPNGAIQLRIHAVVPAAHRLQSRAVFEQRQFEVRQNIEESLRQLDPKLLQNPYLDDMKQQVMDVLVQTLGEAYVDRVLVTELAPQPGVALVFTKAPKRRYDASHAKDGHGEHGDEHAAGDGAEHGEEPSDGHGSGHGNTEKSSGESESASH
jgi:hypothetical protein